MNSSVKRSKIEVGVLTWIMSKTLKARGLRH